MVETVSVYSERNTKLTIREVLLEIFEFNQSVGLWIKLSLTSREVFLAFKHYSKDGKVKHLNHKDYGNGVSEHFVRRICARRIGKQLLSLDFEFSAINDEHITLCKFPASL